MSFTQDAARSLAAKLDALDLTDGERAALNAVFRAAAGDDDVSGFAVAGSNATSDRYANQEVSYFQDRLLHVLGNYRNTYIGETEKNLRR